MESKNIKAEFPCLEAVYLIMPVPTELEEGKTTTFMPCFCGFPVPSGGHLLKQDAKPDGPFSRTLLMFLLFLRVIYPPVYGDSISRMPELRSCVKTFRFIFTFGSLFRSKIHLDSFGSYIMICGFICIFGWLCSSFLLHSH